MPPSPAIHGSDTRVQEHCNAAVYYVPAPPSHLGDLFSLDDVAAIDVPPALPAGIPGLATVRLEGPSGPLGANVMTIDGVRGVRFAVWAPNASRVAVVGDFNTWDARRHPMRLRHSAGIWELFIPRIGAGARYKFDIIGAGGIRVPLKADPVAQQTDPLA